MRLYLDTNILLDLLFEQRPFSIKTQEFLRNIDSCVFIVDSNSLKDVYYVSKKYGDDGEAKALIFIQKIDNPNSKIFKVVDNKYKVRKMAYKYCNEHKSTDLEDVLQYFSALDNECDAIVTNDKNFPNINLRLIRTND